MRYRPLFFRVWVSVVLCSLLCLSVSCSIDEKALRKDTVVVSGREVPESCFQPGKVRVLLTEELASSLGLATDAATMMPVSNVKSVNNAIASLGVTVMERTFPYAGKFEKRTREAGLHLWYDVSFDEKSGLTRAQDELSSIEGVRMVEFCPRVVRSGEIVPSTVSGSVPVQESQSSVDFNDPYLVKQWHYYNDGTTAGTVAGADINVMPAWNRGIVGNRYTQDGREVIVAVVDGGVDFAHEDLADNMWVNPNMSDPDQSHGYNFVSGNYKVTADDHGTHVAGTVAAVNNNGIGVCGVAGGDKANGVPGVRIMSCQIFEGEDGADGARAIKWAADNGAVICQNSWGYDYKQNPNLDYTPQVMKDAIDYFIREAGYDENGVQTGPMAGGIVFFSSGNDSRNIGYPAEYSSCVAVSAIGANYLPASYTNYGDWVDVSAPGGDGNNLVYSTISNNRYGAMGGTSMACPHVSGMAALLVSFFGGDGFTAERLRNMIEGTVKDISQYTGSYGMGKGLIDVGSSISTASTTPPEPVDDLEISAHSNFIDYVFSVPADPDDAVPTRAYVYYSGNSFDIEDEEEVSSLTRDTVVLTGVKAGDEVSGMLQGLKFNTVYYVSVATADYAGNLSALCPVLQAETGDNTPPEFVDAGDIDTIIKLPNTLELDLKVRDRDGHAVTPSLSDQSFASVRMLNDSTLRVSVSSQKAGEGSHSLILGITDGYDEASLKISFEVTPNTLPEKLDDPEDISINMGGGGSMTLDMTDYFSDEDGDVLRYGISYGIPGIVSGTFNGSVLSLVPVSFGQTEVTVTAYDSMNETASVSFIVLVRDIDLDADFYPNPVVDILNIRTGDLAEDVSVKIYSVSGALRMQQEFETVAPFAPVQVDMSQLSAGMYRVVLSYTAADGSSKSVTTDIAKL